MKCYEGMSEEEAKSMADKNINEIKGDEDKLEMIVNRMKNNF